MDLEALTCAVCYEKYDQTQHTPRIIPSCGHTFCSVCLSKIVLDFDAKCPLDKKDIYGDTIEDFPINYAVKQMLEGKSEKGFCSEHRQEMIFACFTDKCMICPECIWRNNHQTHNIKTLNAIREDTLTPRKELETFLEEVEKCSKEVKQAIEEERFTYLNTIKKRFREIRNILEKKEFSLNFEVNLLFDTQIKKINTLIGKDSTWKHDISEKISDLKNIFNHEEFLQGDIFLNEIREYTNKCKSRINFQSAKEEIELIRHGTKERSKSFTSSVKKQFKFLSNLDFPLIDSLEGFTKVFSHDEPGHRHSEPTSKRNSFKTFSSIVMKDDGTSLNIAAANLLSPNISPEKAKELDEALSSSTDHVPKREGLQVLNYIWKRVRQASNIALKLNPSNVSDKVFPYLMADPASFSTVEITLEGTSQSDIPSKEEKSIEKMLSKIVTLEKMCLVLNRTWLASSSTHRNFTKEILHSKRLTDLTLELAQAYMQEDVISDLSTQMPALENVHLDLSETNIRDKDLRLLSRTMLHSAESLESFHLSLFCTQITDTGLRSFALNSTKLKKFFLDVGITKITDRSLHSLSKVLENSLNSLESFTLSMGSNKVTDEGLSKIFKSMPKVKTFFLGLFETYMTDETVEAFVENTLVSMENLEELTLWFQETKISDYSVELIALKLKPLKKLSLNFSGTKVTDESIQTLVRKVLPEMKDLEELELEVGNTDVSHEMLCEINAFQESFKKAYRKSSCLI